MSNGRSILPFAKWEQWFSDHRDYIAKSYSVTITRMLAEWPVLNVRELLTPSTIRSLADTELVPHRVALVLRFLRLMYRNTILPLLAAVSAEDEELTLQSFYIRHIFIAVDRGANATNDASGLVIVRTKRNEARLELKITLFQLALPPPYAFVASSVLTDWSVLRSDEPFNRSEVAPHFNTDIGLGAPIIQMQEDVHWIASALILQDLAPGLMSDNPWEFPSRGSLNRVLSRIRLDLPQHQELAVIIQRAGSPSALLKAILWLQDEVASIFARLQRTIQSFIRIDDATVLEYASLAREQFFIDLSLVQNFDDLQRDFVGNFVNQFWFARTFEIASILAKEQERLASVARAPLPQVDENANQ